MAQLQPQTKTTLYAMDHARMHRVASVDSTAPEKSVCVDSDGGQCLGDPTVDGSWKLVISGTSLLVQRREGGSWVTKGSFSA